MAGNMPVWAVIHGHKRNRIGGEMSETPEIYTVAYLRGFVQLPEDNHTHITNLERALSLLHTRLRQAEADLVKARAALGRSACPRPANNMPNDLLVSDCVASGNCGCENITALTGSIDRAMKGK